MNTDFKFIYDLIGYTGHLNMPGYSASGLLHASAPTILILLKSVSFAILVFSFIKHVKDIETPVEGFKIITYYILLVMLLFWFEAAVLSTLETFYGVFGGADIPKTIGSWTQLTLTETGSVVMGGIFNLIFQAVLNFAYMIARSAQIIQAIIIYATIFTSPIMIPLLAVPNTVHLSTRFLMITFSICLWPLSYSMLNYVGGYILTSQVGAITLYDTSAISKMVIEEAQSNWSGGGRGAVADAMMQRVDTLSTTHSEPLKTLIIPEGFTGVDLASGAAAMVIILFMVIVFYIVVPIIITQLMSGSSMSSAASSAAAKGVSTAVMPAAVGLRTAKGISKSAR